MVKRYMIAPKFRNLNSQDKVIPNSKYMPKGTGNFPRDLLPLRMRDEIRVSLDTIIEKIDLILSTDLTESQRQSLNAVRSSNRSLLDQLSKLMDFIMVRGNNGELEEIDFDLRNTLDTAFEIARIKGKGGPTETKCHVSADVPSMLRGDPGRLRQIIATLTKNVIRAFDRGDLALRVEKEREDVSSLLLHFTISMGGAEITDSKIKRLKKKFGQIDHTSGQNLGRIDSDLDLATCFIEMMGGRLWVENHPGIGPDFHFTALFKASDEGPSNTQLPLKGHDLAGLPTLVVDDNEINRLVFCEMASSWGLRCTEAAGGREALEKISKILEKGEPFSLILTDLQMPGMDGFELARRIKQGPFGKYARIILTTSVGQKGDGERCSNIGISGYLIRPFPESDLLDAIIMVMRHRPTLKTRLVTRYTIQEARKRLGM